MFDNDGIDVVAHDVSGNLTLPADLQALPMATLLTGVHAALGPRGAEHGVGRTLLDASGARTMDLLSGSCWNSCQKPGSHDI